MSNTCTQRTQAAERREQGAAELALLEARGFSVRKLTDFHYRIEDKIDIYPTNRRFHLLGKDLRGGYQARYLLPLLEHFKIQKSGKFKLFLFIKRWITS